MARPAQTDSATHTLSPGLRWLLFALVALAGILALVDRQIIAVLKPTIAAELHWSDDDYGTLGAWFQGATAFALLFAGSLIDKFGVKWVNAMSVVAWSTVATLHGWAHSFTHFVLCRGGLGASEAAVTPLQIKTIATIFPLHLRSTGFGLSNAIASLGAICAPFIIPLLASPYGWRGAFVIAGITGLLWAMAWSVATRNINLNDKEFALPGAENSDASTERPIWKEKAAWSVAGAKALSDSTWWLLLFWMPDFLNHRFGLRGAAVAPFLAIAYSGAALGSLLSGVLATYLLQLGVSVNRVRKSAMLISGILVLPLPLALGAETPFSAALILAIVLAAHQGFSTNLFAFIADVTEKSRIGRMTSFGVFSGNIGGMVTLKVAGLVLAAGLGYLPLFLFAAVSYLLALAWIQLLTPNIEPVRGA